MGRVGVREGSEHTDLIVTPLRKPPLQPDVLVLAVQDEGFGRARDLDGTLVVNRLQIPHTLMNLLRILHRNPLNHHSVFIQRLYRTNHEMRRDNNSSAISARLRATLAI